MSFLTGLYVLGAAAIVFPFVFHLIRRRPQHRVPFSSLMFLKPSPPQLTKKSQLDHLLLLILRAAAILCVAIGFMRPFYRPPSDGSWDDLRGRRMAVLLDVSASMRRADLWSKAIQLVEDQLDQLGPSDDVALFTFADQVKTVIGFSEAHHADLETRVTLVRDAVALLAPTWAHTDLGTALMTVADDLEVLDDRTDFAAASQIVLISDMQEGSRLQGLDGYRWPPEIRVVVHSVSPQPALSNGTLRLLADKETEERASTRHSALPPRRVDRIRVENSSDARAEQFDIHWASGDGATRSGTVSIHVPAGQSRVLRLPQSARPLQADRLILSGDDSAYDNQYFVAPTQQEVVRSVYVGDDDPSDPEGLLFYLNLALPETRRTRVEVQAIPTAPLSLTGRDAPRLVVVGKAVSVHQRQAIDDYLQQGGTVLVVVQDGPMLASLGTAFDGWTVSASVGDSVGSATPTSAAERVTRQAPQPSYALLGDIDFEHALMAPFAASGYGDFTMIRFWQHRHVVPAKGSPTQVIARFDNGHPALIEVTRRKGQYLLLTSGWNPDDSQLARSWKFAVLLSKILRHAGSPELAPSLVVNQGITLPWQLSPQREGHVRLPDASEVRLPAGETRFDQTSVPGLYRAEGPDTSHEFAVNLAASESRTAPLSDDQLERVGVAIGLHATQGEERQRLLQLLDIELESEQQVWRWLILTSLLLLMLESWLAGRSARRLAVPTAMAAGLATES